MISSPSESTVLVTGATGYLAGWVIVELLDRGYAVRATVRDVDRARGAADAIRDRSAGSRDLELVAADLLADDDWATAVAGVDAVIHTASPMPFDESADLITSAREGTRRVLTAAAAAGVRRIVVTSSGVTAYADDPAQPASERFHTKPSGEPLQAYPDSKIHAEHLAWELARELDLELTTVLPVFMQGPPVGRPERSGTIDVIRRLLTGAIPALPHLGWNIVDVRDEARLHVLALESPSAVGQRYLGGGEFRWYRDVAKLVRRELPAHARKVPRWELPNALVRRAARTNPHLAMIVGELGIVRNVDSTKARTELGWSTRPVDDTLLDTARALIAEGAGR